MLFRETYFQAKVLQIMHSEMGYPTKIRPVGFKYFNTMSKLVMKSGGTYYEAAIQIRF